MRQAGHVRFDELFAFHFYDHDFCLSAHEAGLVLGTSNIYLAHKLNGSESSEDFGQAQNNFRAKWLPRQPQAGFWQPEPFSGGATPNQRVIQFGAGDNA